MTKQPETLREKLSKMVSYDHHGVSNDGYALADQIMQLFQEAMLAVVGEDEPELLITGSSTRTLVIAMQNQLRAEQRQAIKQLFEGGK